MEFEIGQLLKKGDGAEQREIKAGDLKEFYSFCHSMQEKMDTLDEMELVEEDALLRQQRALFGEEQAASYYKNKIHQLIAQKGWADRWHPSWYESLTEAVYQEIYGFAGISEWIHGEGALSGSSACKIIGERIFFDVGGVLELQPQTIGSKRREKLRKTLLLPDPTKDRSRAYQEVYLYDGSRVTIYSDFGMTKQGQDVMVFRKYLTGTSTFEDQASRHTIPAEAVLLFKSMIRCGFNVAFTGPVKSAKTTMMSVWQSMENPALEGLCIETDPEIPLHQLMPDAPIMQLVPTEEYLDQVVACAKRSDAQYVILGEARQGKIMNIAVEAANMGTRRSKVTLHTSETVDFAYDVAEKIVRDCGGDLACCMIKVAKSFQYIVQMISLPGNYGKKRLKGLWEMRYDEETMRITMHQICRYRIEADDWVWTYDIGSQAEEIGMEEDAEAFQQFDFTLQELAEAYPDHSKTVHEPPYLRMLWGKR